MASGDRADTGRKRKGAKDEKPQSERFKEAARQLGADESGEAFDKALSKIIKKRPKEE